MKTVISTFFIIISMNLYSQVKYSDFLYDLDSLIKPKIFSYVNANDGSKIYSLLKTVKTETGYYLIRKRYYDMYDLDSTIQFIDNQMQGTIHKESYWFYYINNIRYSCRSKELDVTKIDYNTPNDHFSKTVFNFCSNSIPQIYLDEAIYCGLKTIIVLGKETECLRYKVRGISIDKFGRKSTRKGYTYLGKNIGVVMFTNNNLFRKTWKLKEIVNYN